MPFWARLLWGTMVAAMVVVFAYGLVLYPDAPLHPCGQAFCGKTGKPHTAVEYQDFMAWQTLLLWIWPPGFLINLAYLKVRRARS